MQFKHPELFWALLLLIIPIIVHLFQLRKFQKVWFTNVAFLKEIKLQTRKSEKLKKWLILFTRLAALAALVFAFTEPFLPNKNAVSSSLEKETVIYIDNSFSMQAKGKKGPLFKRAIQNIISNLDASNNFTLFTNNSTFSNTNLSDIKNTLLDLPYSNEQLTYKEAYLKGVSSFSSKVNTEKNFIFISDFQEKEIEPNFSLESTIQTHFVQETPEYLQNISIDSVYISKREAGNIEVTSLISSQEPVENVTISLVNQEQTIGKTATSIEKNKTAKAIFSVPENTEFSGYLALEDESLPYDNKLYFSIHKPEKINIASINEATANFLNRLYANDEEFNYLAQDYTSIDYNNISNQNLLVINELKNFNSGFINTVRTFARNGGHVVVIPSKESNIEQYNSLLQDTHITFQQLNNQQRHITDIKFEHPLFSNVFEKSVDNFQYPNLKESFELTGGHIALALEDQNAFLTTEGNYSVFAAPLNKDNTNFTELRDLVVPTFYNLGKQSLQLPTLYYCINKTNNIEVTTQLQEDTVLEIKGNETSFIPLQKALPNKVRITTNELPETSGNYNISYNNNSLTPISYNYKRIEGNLSYFDLSNYNLETQNNIPDLLNNLKSDTNNNELWKWFVIFAIICLCIEMFIIKFLK
ncbi:BatA domain-containing protein [Neptunitalea lumnitzerae]|uniref:Membrane protein n=1 Tax=Neptunitalea lumnitzerae TaxID=2965509 RepID=A0ABQ5MJZ0_9FLAO|nr:BatA domain-containing protein [Neptunitalea sp. Y10]GLB49714.1 membrane protein [Neptunitalea sp. Y10]